MSLPDESDEAINSCPEEIKSELRELFELFDFDDSRTLDFKVGWLK